MKILAAALLAPLLPSVVQAEAPSGLSKINSDGRALAFGDFDELNTLLENASIKLPEDIEVDERIGIARLTMTISNMICYDMSIGDMSISHSRESDQAINVDIEIMALDLKCEMDYVYTYGIFDGDGSVKISTDNNSAFTKLKFVSNDFDQEPPTGSSVDQCAADIEITNLDFEGDLVSEIIEIFQRLIRGVVEREVGEVVCDELGSLGTTLVSNILDLAQEKLDPFIGPVGEEFTDPLYAEKNLVIPGTLNALDFLDTENAVTILFNQVLNSVDLVLGAFIADESQSTSSGRDLTANIFLRDYFLGDDRSFTVEASQLPLDSTVFFDGHDRMFETTMTLNEVKVFGLDTLSVFNPFTQIGRYTLQNELTWEKLTVEFDITVDIKPSSLDDAILQDPTSNGITERITVDFGVDNVEVLASLLAVIDETRLGDMELGSLMNTEDLIPCLLSVVDQAKLVGLDVDPQEVNEPTLSGFISPGLDRVISDSAVAAFAMYTGVLRQSLPKIFQVTVREFLSEFIVDPYMAENSNSLCPATISKNGMVNFQEFFSEGSSYGDVPSMLRNIMDSELLSTDGETGQLRLNKALIAPLTERQSGQEGTLLMPGDVIDLSVESVTQFGLDSAELRGFDLRFESLDSFVAPVELLEPEPTNQYILRNTINVAKGGDSLGLRLKGLVSLTGDPVLNMRNEMDFTLNLAGSELFAAVLAKMEANSLLSFPLRDLTNLDCWLSTLGTTMLDGTGTHSGAKALSLETLLLEIPSIDFNVMCTNCTSAGLSILPELLATFENGGITDVMERRLLDVGLEIVRSDYTQELINKATIEGSLRCPHSRNFIDTSAESDYQISEFPSLSYESLESIAFVATTMMQMATVIVAEAHEDYDPEQTNPLSGQMNLDVTASDRLVDFTALDSSVGEWADQGIEKALEYLNDIVEDSTAPNGKDLRINSVLRSNILDENGGFKVEFNNLSVGSEDTEMSLKNVRILGLDSIDELEVLDAVAPQTLMNKLRFKTLSLEAVLSLVGNDNLAASTKVQEDISVSIELSDVDISLALLLAMDLDLLGSIQLSSILEIRNLIPCMLSAAKDAKLTELEVNVGGIVSLTVNGYRSDELNQAAANGSRLLLETYREKIVASMPGFFDLTVRALVNNWMQYMMGEWSAVACPSEKFELSRVLSFIDLRDLFLPASESKALGGEGRSPYGDLFQTVVGFIQDVVFRIDETTGLSSLNEIFIDPWTRGQSNISGILSYPGELLQSDTRLKVGGLDTNIALRASDARVSNLDSIGAPLKLLEVVKVPHHLNNTVTLGLGEKPVQIALRLLLALSGDDNIEVRNELDVSVNLEAATLLMQTLSMVDESRFYNFPLRDTLDLNCWLATIPAPELDASGVRLDGTGITAALETLAASVSRLNVNVSCIECSSPRMPEFAELISSPSVQNEVTSAANEILQYVGELAGGNFAQVQIDQMLFDAARKCPHSPSYDPEYTAAAYEPLEAPDTEFSFSYLIMLGSVTLILILLASMVVYIVRCIVRRRHRKWLGTLPPHQIRQIARQQRKELDDAETLSGSTRSMFTSPEIPRLIRWVIPIIILVNIAFFLSGHLSIGATVNIEAEIAGEELKVEKFFEFSMARSTIDIWKAGGRELAILIFIFSGIWPYTKQLITLALWFLPPASVSVTRRGSILLWLDWLTKWSMVDVFVLLISIAAFRVSITSPNVSFLPEGIYAIDMMVVPLWGLYANMIAQLISQVSSHLVIYYHRRIVRSAQKSSSLRRLENSETQGFIETGAKGVSRVSVDRSLDDDTTEETIRRQALRKHQFSRPHRGETEHLVVRRGVNGLFGGSLVALVVLVIVGCSIPSFSLDIFGLVGVAVEFGQDFDEATKSHSVFSVLKLLMQEAKFLGTGAHYAGLLSLSLILLFTVLLVPIAQSLALTRQWFFPATKKQRNRMAVMIEILQAWQYAEVYLVAVFVSSWQLGPISEFMINAYCENLKGMFAQAVYYGVLRETDAQCFSVQASVSSGSFWLAAAAVLLALMNTFVNKAVAQYFRDKEGVARRLHEGDKANSGLTSASDGDDFPLDAGFSARIKPVPVLFTDTFRWLLRPDSSLPASSRALFVDSDSDHWDLPEAQAIAEDDNFDGSIVQGQYLPKEYADSEKKVYYEDRRSNSQRGFSGRYPDAAASKRRLDFDDGVSAMESIPGGSSVTSASMVSRGERGGKLKDDATYATPPGEYRVRSQPPPSMPQSSTQSIALSAAKSAALSRPASERSIPRSHQVSQRGITSPSSSIYHGDRSAEEESTIEEILQDDEYTEVRTAFTARSEYVEETIDEDYEEYTVRTMSDSGEDGDYEDYSEYDSQAHQVV